MEKITVVTALTGDRDLLKAQTKIEEVDYVCFTDNMKLGNMGWELRKACDKFDPLLNAKIHKVLIHKYINTRYSVWIDSSVKINKNIVRMTETFLKDNDIAVYSHVAIPRDEPILTIEDEIKACIENNKEKTERILEQYKENKYPKRIPAICTIIFRRHTPQIERLNERWWSEICRYSTRDQLSFPYVFQDYYEIGGRLLDDFDIIAHKTL